MSTKTAIEQAFDAGKSSALAQLASGMPVLMVDEMGLGDEDFANARGWNSVFVSAENGKLLSAAAPAAKVRAQPDFSSDAFNKQAEREILRSGTIGPRDRN